jgi:hypothetical protein
MIASPLWRGVTVCLCGDASQARIPARAWMTEFFLRMTTCYCNAKTAFIASHIRRGAGLTHIVFIEIIDNFLKISQLPRFFQSPSRACQANFPIQQIISKAENL